MTIHKAKGKEFTNVVYFDLSKDKPTKETHLEEERRVTYVGATRAQDRLLITVDRKMPSPFLKALAINPELDDFTLSYLERLPKNARKLTRDLEARHKKKATLFQKYPELTHEFFKPTYSVFPKLLEFWQKKRVSAAAKTIQMLESEIQNIREAKISISSGWLDAVESEIQFQKLLGVMDEM